MASSAITRIPPEILQNIFKFVFGYNPFRRNERRTYGHLSRVCTTWNRALASTPNICQGLEIHLDGPLAGAIPRFARRGKNFRDNLKPLLAIVSRNLPYHLVLDAFTKPFDDADGDIPALANWILKTEPPPTNLTINDNLVFGLIYGLGERDNQISRLELNFKALLDRPDYFDLAFEVVFPRLKIFVSSAPVACFSMMWHSKLQSLTLSNVVGGPHLFARVLLGFPSLRELSVRSVTLYEESCAIDGGHKPSAHPALEFLAICGEDLFFLFECLAFPALRFLGLEAWGDHDDWEYLEVDVPPFLQRCGTESESIICSMKGSPPSHLFDLVIRNLPIKTQLHLDVDDIEVSSPKNSDSEEEEEEVVLSHPWKHITEVFCSHPEKLRWLSSATSRPLDGEPIKVYVPEPDGQGKEDEERIADAREWGYVLEVLPRHIFTRRLRTLPLPTAIDWDIE